MRDRIRGTVVLAAPTPPTSPARRLVATGILGRAGARTVRTVRTEAGTTGTVTPARQDRTAHLALAVARHLAAHRPGAPMTEAARLTIALRIAGTGAAARPLLAVLPWPTAGITRGEYALRLRKTAWASVTSDNRCPGGLLLENCMCRDGQAGSSCPRQAVTR
ncbi:hypothetical protein ACFXKG_18400 [Streptomyces sp. NPDC059255]|uniref:hypothetical protein n=1 Tax=Streptomyces sp. NPDC059255 TaxID=3346793 RepID=UPI0036C68B7D